MVIEVGSGGGALDLLDRNAQIDLVILDFAMGCYPEPRVFAIVAGALKKGPLRVTPHSDPPTIGRNKQGTYPKSVRRLARVGWYP